MGGESAVMSPDKQRERPVQAKMENGGELRFSDPHALGTGLGNRAALGRMGGVSAPVQAKLEPQSAGGGSFSATDSVSGAVVTPLSSAGAMSAAPVQAKKDGPTQAEEFSSSYKKANTADRVRLMRDKAFALSVLPDNEVDEEVLNTYEYKLGSPKARGSGARIDRDFMDEYFAQQVSAAKELYQQKQLARLASAGMKNTGLDWNEDEWDYRLKHSLAAGQFQSFTTLLTNINFNGDDSLSEYYIGKMDGFAEQDPEGYEALEYAQGIMQGRNSWAEANPEAALQIANAGQDAAIAHARTLGVAKRPEQPKRGFFSWLFGRR